MSAQSDKRLFDAVRVVKGAALTQRDVDVVKAALAMAPVGAKPRALADAGAFFTAVRKPLFAGSISQSQVDGIERKLRHMGEAGWSTAWTAYGFATVYHETAKRMQPVREGLDASDAWRKKNLRYYPWFGRGDVQLTWEDNYRWADGELGLGGALLANPDLALEPEHSARILVAGMEQGAYSGKKLGDYLPSERGTEAQFKAARPIVNAHDKDALIAGYAMTFQAGLVAGSWA